MKVIVSESEIKNAVIDRLKSQGISVEGREVAISFSMGRKNKEGLAATVELIDPNLPVIADGVDDENEEEPQGDTTPAAASITSTVAAKLATPSPKVFVSRAPAAPAPQAPVADAPAASAAPVVAAPAAEPAGNPVTGTAVAAETTPDAPFDVADQQPNDPAPEPEGQPEAPADAAPAAPVKPKSLFAKD